MGGKVSVRKIALRCDELRWGVYLGLRSLGHTP
jgi:hypothetical protein